MSLAPISLPAETLGQVFPFHLAIDRELRISQAGASLMRACPRVSAGAPLAAHFRIRRPLAAPTFESICQSQRRLFILESLESALVLKGQVVLLPEEAGAVFLLSPWVTSSEQVRDLGLSLADFPIHDPIVDLILLLQSQQTAIGDAARQAQQLAERQRQLVDANQRLTSALTASAEAQAALRESEQRYRSVVDNVKEVIFQTDAAGRWTFLNPAWTDFTGFGVAESLGKPFLDYVHPDDRELNRQRFLTLIERAAESYHQEVRYITREGRCRWIEVFARLTLAPDGSAVGTSGTLNDVTEQREAQRALRESEAILRGFYDSTPFLMGVLELEGDTLRFAAVNRAVSQRFGNTQEEMFGQPLSIWLEPAQLEQWLHSCRESLRTGASITFEYQRQLGDGVHWRTATIGPIPTEHGRLPRFAYVVGDTTERKLAEIALRTSTLRLSTLIANMQAGVLVEDERRRIVLTNQTFCDMFAIPAPPAALIGADCSRSAEETKHLFSDPEQFVSGVEALLRVRQSSVGDQLQLVDGRTLERDYVPIFLDNAYAGHLWLYRDISERKQVEIELSLARDAALESSRLKSEFLAIVSHEVRTPLNAVIGMAELLLESKLAEDQHEYATTIEESAQSLLTVINDILDYSKMEAGKLILDDVDFSPVSVVSRASRILRGRIREKGLSFVTELSSRMPSFLRGDDGRLHQVLLNLLSNAVKFTERGGIVVRVEPVGEAGGQVRLRFSVTDTGIGIPEAARQRLFQPFSQADGSVTRRYGGTGLGLAISKSLVELMGGAIGCQSAEGVGSTFWFEVCLRVSSQAPDVVAEPSPPAPVRVARGSKVLLVEDNPVNRQIALHQLRKLGVGVEVAHDGCHAVELITVNPSAFQLVLMDCHMPVMDGYAAARAIRALEERRGGHIPIVAISASTLQSDRDTSFAAGMDDFLSKPVRHEALAQLLGRWLPAQGDADEPPLDGSVLAELRTFDQVEPGLFATVVGEYIDDTRSLLAAMRVASASADPAALMHAAHRIRGGSLNIGAMRLGEACAQIEACARAGSLADEGQLDEAERAFEQARLALEAECARASAEATLNA